MRAAISISPEAVSSAAGDLLALESAEGTDARFRQRRHFQLYMYGAAQLPHVFCALTAIFAYSYDDASTGPDDMSPELKTLLGALEADCLCPHGSRLLRGGASAFAAQYPFLLKGHGLFTDAELPSEVCCLPPDFLSLWRQ